MGPYNGEKYMWPLTEGSNTREESGPVMFPPATQLGGIGNGGSAQGAAGRKGNIGGDTGAPTGTLALVEWPVGREAASAYQCAVRDYR